MPTGKLPIRGAAFLKPVLPDCSCMELLLNGRHKKYGKPSDAEVESWKKRCNDAVGMYAGISLAENFLTFTEMKRLLTPVINEAKRLLKRVDAGTEPLSNYKAFRHLWIMLSVDNLGVQGMDYLQQNPAFFHNKQRIGDIRWLVTELKNAHLKPLSEKATIALRILAGIELTKPPKGGKFAQPHALRLLCETEAIWLAATHRKTTRLSPSAPERTREASYYRWLCTVLGVAKRALPRGNRIPVPTAEALQAFRRERVK